MLIKDEFYRAVLENISDGVYVCNTDRRIIYWSPGAERITGYSAEDMRGKDCGHGLLVHLDENGNPLCEIGCPLRDSLTQDCVREAQVYLHHKEGHRVPVLVRTNAIHNKTGQIEGVVEVFSDNSALFAALRQVEELSAAADTDPLTGVGNRRFMEARLGRYLAERRRREAGAGLLFIDIDHFKNVNDTYGHAMGDRVLKMVAETLKQNLRASDWVARWGGEEFLILLPRLDPEGLTALGEKLRMLVASSFIAIDDDTQVSVTISIGATLLRPKDTRQTAVARADRLLYESKTRGRNLLTWAA